MLLFIYIQILISCLFLFSFSSWLQTRSFPREVTICRGEEDGKAPQLIKKNKTKSSFNFFSRLLPPPPYVYIYVFFLSNVASPRAALPFPHKRRVQITIIILRSLRLHIKRQENIKRQDKRASTPQKHTHTELKPHSHLQSFGLIPGRRHDGDRLVVSGIDRYQTYPSRI